MVLILTEVIILLISIIFIIIGKLKNKKIAFTTGVSIILMQILITIILFIYWIEKDQERAESINHTSSLTEHEELPIPDRIVVKDEDGKYEILHSWDGDEFSDIYSCVYNEMVNTIEGKVYSEEEISLMQENGSFIECDYNTKSKNFVFMLDEDEIGAIRRFDDSGQVIKTSLENKEKIKKIIKDVSKKEEKYDFDKSKSYTVLGNLTTIPTDFQSKENSVYQKILTNGEESFKTTVEELGLNLEELPNVNFEKENVIFTITKYKIDKITQNVGNIKYNLREELSSYNINVLVTSKVVNENCIYINKENSSYQGSYPTTSTENPITNVTESGVIKNISDGKIEIGLDENYSTYIVELQNTTYIKDYEKNETIDKSKLQVGDIIYVEGIKEENSNGLSTIKASNIEKCSKGKVKSEVQKYLLNTYRVDTTGIEYKNVNSNGNGYIVTSYTYDKFKYPIKLYVDSNTETYLGMGYHVQDNYGYVLHEMCDITLDTKITDIDNIKGKVKIIEYIAD